MAQTERKNHSKNTVHHTHLLILVNHSLQDGHVIISNLLWFFISTWHLNSKFQRHYGTLDDISNVQSLTVNKQLSNPIQMPAAWEWKF